MDGGFGEDQTNATGRAPASVLIAPSSTIYVTELYYDLLREVKGVTFGSGTTSISATNVVIPPPVLQPNSGYFPECQTILATSLAPSVYYTTDGTIPTTNSPTVQITNISVVNDQVIYEGSFQWCNALLDLSSLRLIAASGTNVSVVTNGVSSLVNQIGFPFSRVAGSGSTAVIPVVVNLQSNATLASLSFDLEIIPTTGATPPIAAVTLLPISTNDFLQLVGPAPGNAPVNYQSFPYSPGSNGLGLAIYAPPVNSGLNVHNFAVLTLLEVPIPATAVEGQSYTLNVRDASGTSNAAQGTVLFASLPIQTLTISNYQYFAGDSSPSSGYEAGEFGDGILNNSDVNNALLASLGIHVPFTFTDAYSAMDVYPETATEIGDGLITYLDWQHILLRSLGVGDQQLGPLLDQRRLSFAQAHRLVARPDRPHRRFPKSRAGHHRDPRRGDSPAGDGLVAAGFHPRRNHCPIDSWQYLFHPGLCQCPAGLQLVRPAIPRHARAQRRGPRAGPDSI